LGQPTAVVYGDQRVLVAVHNGRCCVDVLQGEVPMVAMNVLLLALAATVAWGRFGPYAFTA
jgi:hypothetical protein